MPATRDRSVVSGMLRRSETNVLSENIITLAMLLALKKEELTERAYAAPPSARKRGIEGLKEKLHPSRTLPKRSPSEIADGSPLDVSTLTKLGEFRCIASAMGYDSSTPSEDGTPLRVKQFAEALVALLRGRSVTEASITEGIRGFLNRYPPPQRRAGAKSP